MVVEYCVCEVDAIRFPPIKFVPNIFANLRAYEPISLVLLTAGKRLLKRVTRPYSKDEEETAKVEDALMSPDDESFVTVVVAKEVFPFTKRDPAVRADDDAFPSVVCPVTERVVAVVVARVLVPSTLKIPVVVRLVADALVRLVCPVTPRDPEKSPLVP